MESYTQRQETGDLLELSHFHKKQLCFSQHYYNLCIYYLSTVYLLYLRSSVPILILVLGDRHNEDTHIIAHLLVELDSPCKNTMN